MTRTLTNLILNTLASMCMPLNVYFAFNTTGVGQFINIFAGALLIYSTVTHLWRAVGTSWSTAVERGEFTLNEYLLGLLRGYLLTALTFTMATTASAPSMIAAAVGVGVLIGSLLVEAFGITGDL